MKSDWLKTISNSEGCFRPEMGLTVDVLHALVDFWFFNLSLSEFLCSVFCFVFYLQFIFNFFNLFLLSACLIPVVDMMGFLYFYIQHDLLLGSPVVFRLSHIGFPAPTTSGNALRTTAASYNFSR